MKLFIDLKYIKDNQPIISYVNENDIYPYVIEAQRVYLSNLIGQDIYNELQETEFSNLSIIKQEFLTDIVKPFILMWTMYLYGQTTNFRFTNRGISKESTTNSLSISLDEVQYLNRIYRDRAESYSKILSDYMLNNKSEFNIECKTFNIYNPYIPSFYKTKIKVIE